MGEDNLNVGGTGAEGGATEGQPAASQQNQPSIDGMAEQLLGVLQGKLASQVEEIMKPYISQMEGLRKVQGDIDRSRNEFKDRLTELNRLTKGGMTQEQALEHMDKQKAESDWRQNLQQELSDLRSLIAGNGNGQQQATAANVFQEFGLDVKDPRIAPLLAKQYANKQEMEIAALRAFHQINTSPNPTPAQGASMHGGAGKRNQKDISQIHDSASLYALGEQELFGR